MGGCRCSFQECPNTTANRPGLHFFHYPAKNSERAQQWMLRAGKVEKFQGLSIPQLKNKVVCEEHFKPECFMNYRRESLTKIAIPTEWNISDDLPSAPPKKEPEDCGLVRKKVTKVITRVVGGVKKKEMDLKAPLRMVENVKEIKTLPAEEPMEIPLLEEPQMIAPEPRDVSKTIFDIPVKIVPDLREENLIEKEEISTKKLAHLDSLLIANNRKLETIQSTLQELVKTSLTSQNAQKEEKTIPPTTMKKTQLYQGIKKHINPVMATLLHMELFGSADHEWLEDEKELAMELYSMGESCYKIFRDDFRLRLPAITDVQRWKKESGSS